MMLVTQGFILSVRTLKEPQIVIAFFVPLVLSRHAVIIVSGYAIAIIAILKLVLTLLFTSFFKHSSHDSS